MLKFIKVLGVIWVFLIWYTYRRFEFKWDRDYNFVFEMMVEVVGFKLLVF